MTADSAFALALSYIEDLKRQGIRVKITAYTHEESPEKTMRDTDWDARHNASSELWCHVSLHPADTEEEDLIERVRDELSDRGIGFDSGRCDNTIDWELDWSFHFYPE